MIKIEKVRGLMSEKRVTGKELAKKMNIAPKTFYAKMKKGVFGSDEIEVMMTELEIEEPMEIFFAKK